MPMITLHGTCITLDGAGILLEGPAGAGKSDLALRLIMEHGARLVSDDRVELDQDDGRVIARAPAAITGMIEVRGLGIVRVPADGQAPLALVARLVETGTAERMPEPRWRAVAGIELPEIEIAPFEASAPARLLLALAVALQPELLVS